MSDLELQSRVAGAKQTHREPPAAQVVGILSRLVRHTQTDVIEVQRTQQEARMQSCHLDTVSASWTGEKHGMREAVSATFEGAICVGALECR